MLRSLTGPRRVRWKAVSTSASCRAQTTELAFPAQRVGKSTPIAGPASGPARRNSGALSRLAVARENGGSGARRARTSRRPAARGDRHHRHRNRPAAPHAATCSPKRGRKLPRHRPGATHGRAGQLLSTTAKTLAEVAMRAGYSNPSNFHRAFLSLTGMTPRRFRERSGPTRHRQRCLVEAGSDSRMAAVARPRPPSYWRSERQVSEFDQ